MKPILIILLLTCTWAQPPTISFTGDCTIASSLYNKNFDEYYAAKGPAYFLSDMAPILGNTDLSVVNLETTITIAAGVHPINKGYTPAYHFRGDPAYLDILKLGSVKMVSLANNHTYDYGDTGYVRTIHNLDSTKIPHYEYADVVQDTIRGKTVTFIADMGFHFNDSLVAMVKTWHAKSDFVIVSIHWGKEHAYKPCTLQKQIGHALIDAGADLVIGNHPHVLQPIEKYHGKYIAYSLGNFCFGGNSNPQDKLAAIITATLGTPVKLTVTPIKVSSRLDTNDFHPMTVTGKESKTVFERLKWKVQ